MIETSGKLYIGREVEQDGSTVTKDALLYDPDDLLTHGVVVGMTGSGKTGLCIDILEEAALQGVPAIMIDPKGDITNTLLHFPDLQPEDFAPWLNTDQIRKEGKSLYQAAQETAELWRSGLAGWDIEGARIQALKESAQFTIFTPGSDAGVPLSIIDSLSAPALDWSSNVEVLREQISSTVTALLGLVGLQDIDPVTSREHILLATIFEAAWSNGRDLTLEELIMQIQSPPFAKMGVLETDVFYPAAERFKLVAAFNALVAAPSFQAWLNGRPLNVESLLYTDDGRPRHSVFYIAHLSDEERMFIVTLLFSIIETWMRTQSGTTSLRALVYFDEIAGYLPPSKRPPSKEPMLRMLKQARAFGIGLLLATQNPVDVDYKGLSNAGTWFIGRLATAQDKDRLLDGLKGAGAGAGDIGAISDQISSLGKRVFLIRNVHENAPQLFQTRWAMNYLAGPMTRLQIPELNQLAGADNSPAAETARPAAKPATPETEPAGSSGVVSDALPGTLTRPAVPDRYDEAVLPLTFTVAEAVRAAGVTLPDKTEELGILYVPNLMARAVIHYDNSKYDVRTQREKIALVPVDAAGGRINWEEYLLPDTDGRDLNDLPEQDARYLALEKPLSESTALRDLSSDYVDWLYRQASIPVKVNKELDIYAGPDDSEESFRQRCIEAAEDAQEKEVKKLEDTYARKAKSLEDKLSKEEKELREDEQELARRKQNEVISYGETILSWFGGRRRSVSSSLSKRDMRARAEEEVIESQETIAELQEDLQELHEELQAELQAIEERWTAVALNNEEIALTPYKKDIDIEFFGVAWLPLYLVQTAAGLTRVPANPLGRS